jgi:hypothetical protein
MSTVRLAGTASSEAAQSEPSNSVIPWYVWTGVLAVTSAYIGGEWDVSWHRSIGRDSFWTAPCWAVSSAARS